MRLLCSVFELASGDLFSLARRKWRQGAPAGVVPRVMHDVGQVCVYIHIHVHVHIHLHIHTHIHIHIHLRAPRDASRGAGKPSESMRSLRSEYIVPLLHQFTRHWLLDEFVFRVARVT